MSRAADPRPEVRFWRRAEVQVAIVAGLFALITGIGTEIIKKYETKKDSSAAQPQIAITNVNSIQPSTSVQLDGALSLERFTLNTNDSPFQLCTLGVTECSRGNAANDLRQWNPSDRYWDKHVNHGPIFDVVVSNGMHQSAVLTSTDVVIYREWMYGEGDNGLPPHGGVLKVLHRYLIKLGNSDSVPEDGRPYTKIVDALEPIELPATQPGRFQVALENTGQDMRVLEMEMCFHFGSKGSVRTERFRVGF